MYYLEQGFKEELKPRSCAQKKLAECKKFVPSIVCGLHAADLFPDAELPCPVLYCVSMWWWASWQS